jgi:hypothetical protein
MKKIVVMMMICMVLSSCINQHPTPSKPSNEFPLKGVSLSPKSFNPDDFTNFFEKAGQAGSILSWAGDWNELKTNESPVVVTELARTHGLIPVVQAQFFTQSTGQLIRPLTEKTKQDYVTSAVSFAEKYTPAYLGFGIEINALYEKSPDDFEEFVTLYDTVYKRVKEVSPTTQVFTIFQLEKMKGLHGGLYGGENTKNTEWWLLNKFECDITVFTTYPGLIYKNPSDIPDDYYTEIVLHTKTRIAFTEMGWHTSTSIPGWESSEKEQAEFVKTFFELTKDLTMEFVIWSFLYDQDIFEPFSSMGLYAPDGNPKLAWEEWIKQKTLFIF